jgi:enamine deaminase RidA (YjgF/YER057c/UK114 family)
MKENFTYGEWTKDKFSEVVTVTGPGKLIFLAGVGSEDENDGSIRHKGDFLAQCRYAFDKIERLLGRHGATLGDIVKMVTYLTDIRCLSDYNKFRREVFRGHPLPAHTLLNIAQLAWPGMMVEIDVTAVAPEEASARGRR